MAQRSRNSSKTGFWGGEVRARFVVALAIAAITAAGNWVSGKIALIDVHDRAIERIEHRVQRIESDVIRGASR